MTQTDDIKMVVTHDRQERQPIIITAPKRNWRFSASYDSFVVNQTFVLRTNICDKNRHLRVAANRQAVKKPNFNIYLQKQC
jgi:putative heme iron utilization protein